MSCHLVLGDASAEALREVLGHRADIRIHRDDLAIGPLADIDHISPIGRVRFWDDVFPLSSFDFSDVLPAGNAQLAALPAELTLWTGTSCGEALLLRRLAWWRQQTRQTFQLIVPDTRGQESYVSHQMPLSLIATAQIAEARPQSVPPAKLIGLADEWQDIRQQNSMFRGWNGQSFSHLAADALDEELLTCIKDYWLPCSQIAGQWIEASHDFFRSDVLAMWRLRSLAAKGVIEISPAEDIIPLFAYKARRKHTESLP